MRTITKRKITALAWAPNAEDGSTAGIFKVEIESATADGKIERSSEIWIGSVANPKPGAREYEDARDIVSGLGRKIPKDAMEDIVQVFKENNPEEENDKD